MSDRSEKIRGFGIGEAGKIQSSTPLDEIKAEQLQPIGHERMVECSCGHVVPASCVMSASMGSSCPDCYDDMSD